MCSWQQNRMGGVSKTPLFVTFTRSAWGQGGDIHLLSWMSELLEFYCENPTRSGVRTHADIRPLDLKSNALTTRPSWWWTQPRHFQLSDNCRISTGTLAKLGSSPQWDLNSRPLVYKTSALTPELWRRLMAQCKDYLNIFLTIDLLRKTLEECLTRVTSFVHVVLVLSRFMNWIAIPPLVVLSGTVLRLLRWHSSCIELGKVLSYCELISTAILGQMARKKCVNIWYL